MGIIIKKATKGTVVSLVGLAGFLLVLIVKFFLGGAHINLSNLASSQSDLISSAQADEPGSVVGGCSCGSDGGGGSG